ncbi:MAG: hypothetical protein AAGA55_06290 [Planctomycetota bacterium]
MRLLMACMIVTASGTASADIEQITQRFILNQPLLAPNAAIDFFAQVDLGTISGIGEESAVITAASIRILERADESSPFFIIGAGDLLTPVNPYAEVPFNLRADFTDGVFEDVVRIIDDPDSTGVNYLLVDGGAGLLNIGGADMLFGFDIFSVLSYRLESSAITPAPASGGLLLAGGIVMARRRREQVARTAKRRS